MLGLGFTASTLYRCATRHDAPCAVQQVVRTKDNDIMALNKSLDATNTTLEATRQELSTAQAALKVRLGLGGWRLACCSLTHQLCFQTLGAHMHHRLISCSASSCTVAVYKTQSL